MRPARRHLVALIGLALAGCGASDEDEPKGRELPRATVNELQTRLDEVERRYRDAIENDNAGACTDISNDSFAGPDRGIEQILSELPDDVDPELRTAVNKSFANLRTLAEEGCADVKPPSKTEPDPEPEPVPEAPVPEVAPPDEKAPEQTLPEEELPSEDGGGGVPPGQGGTPPGQNGTPGDGGGAQALPGVEQD